MAQLFANNANSATVGILAVGATSITLAPGTGSKFPTPAGGDYFLATLIEMLGDAEVDWEIVKITARAGDVLTAVRAQEGTTDRLWPAGTPIDLRFTAGSVGVLQAGINDTNIVRKNTTQTFSAVQKSTVTPDNDLTFDLSTFMDGTCTPTAGGSLEFTNIATGQKFEILFTNTTSFAFTKGSNIKCSSTFFQTISTTGRYRISGSCLDGTNVDLDVSAAHV